ncbi:MAG: SH3 domain-containing protein [Butyrivibrio sp.]|nr:SH3 domain-containing protein [Butyrivibrio sp.]
MKQKCKKIVRNTSIMVFLLVLVFLCFNNAGDNLNVMAIDAASNSATVSGASEIIASATNDVSINEIMDIDSIVDPKTDYSVSMYSNTVTMYTTERVNVREGAGTDYDKIGTVSYGSAVSVTGITDNGWYCVSYNGETGYMLGDYLSEELSGMPYVFVGDSRTVQMGSVIGGTSNTYIAKVGEGYSWFTSTALSQISQYAGAGTSLIINFGVNDLYNADKYISLINSYIDEWTDAGIKVYYASVNPVEDTTVTNEEIDSFNQTLKSGLDSRVTWIDSNSYLKNVGYSTTDGLHYSNSTYRTIYSYYMSCIS